MKLTRRLAMFLLILFSGPLLMLSCGNIELNGDWRTADRTSAGIAPAPDSTPEAIVQVYAARAFNWRGVFGVHTWIAVKPEGARAYTVHQVIGWRGHWNRPVVVSHRDDPDRAWYGNRPTLLADVRGERAQALIPAIESAVGAYPYPREYKVWPGPNSNTFTAWVARQVPALELELPTTAIGKDYLANGDFLARSPSGSGMQLSLGGLLGVTAGRYEGLELNLLGLSFGIDPLGPALKLPGIGRLGLDLDRPASQPR